MPDTTTSPGRLLLRDLNGPTNEQGAGAPRRTSPGETAAVGSVRINGRANGGVARGERAEPRWRDIQWVDFISGPDSDPPAAPRAEPYPAPEPTTAMVEPAKVAEAAPPLGSLLWLFAAAAPATSLAKKSAAIRGLPPRFTRVPVPRPVPQAAHQSPGYPGSIRLQPPASPITTASTTRPVGLVTRPRMPSAADAPPPLRTSRLADPEQTDHERPLPASILTPVSVAPALGEPEPPGWRPVVTAKIAASGAAGRRAAALAGAAARTGLARARSALPRWTREESGQPDDSAEKQPIQRPIFDASHQVSPFVAAHGSRLRVSGVAAFLVVLAAVGIYIGGTLIAHVAEPNASPSPVTASASPSDAVTKQLAIADKALHPGAPAAPPAETLANPPSDPAARAAFYIARAKTGDAAAQYDVGVLYAQGQGLVQDYASAATWFRAAAAQGNVAAEYNLGVLYAQGLGVTANQTEAINWYRSAAAQDHPAAEFNLALAYATGSGTQQDFAAAARWYQKAAAQGLTAAMINLAILYEAGNGVDRSPVDAYAWYDAAGERGDGAAKTRAGELFQQFNDNDKARAEGLAATIGAALDSFKPQSFKPEAPPA